MGATVPAMSGSLLIEGSVAGKAFPATGKKPPLQAAVVAPAYCGMLKKSVPVLLLSVLLTGCASQLTNLSALHQARDTNNLYRVEVAFHSRQQTIRWKSIKPYVVVGKETYEMRPTMLMTNRWEGLIPVPPGVREVEYRYKLDFQYNRMGAPGNDSALSSKYLLRIID